MHCRATQCGITTMITGDGRKRPILKKFNRKAALLVSSAFICLLAMTGCKLERKPNLADVTQYAREGGAIKTWGPVDVLGAGSGWVKFRTAEGRTITLDADHSIAYR